MTSFQPSKMHVNSHSSCLISLHILQTVLGAGWLLAAVCLAAPILVQHQLMQDDLSSSRLEMALFKTLSKPIWSLGLSWVIFVCVSGYGGKNCKGS
jgi:hypothetical protein